MPNLPIGFMWKARLHQTIAWSTAGQHRGILMKFDNFFTLLPNVVL
jgi:hypothetical protein